VALLAGRSGGRSFRQREQEGSSRGSEYFHGDTGAGLGAGHQTGWTAVVAKLMQQSGE